MSDDVATTASQNHPGCLDGPTLFVLVIGGGAGVWACFAQGGWWPGAGAALAFLALATVAAIIANVLRRAIKPQAVIASGFLDLLWAHVFWGIGPQSFGVLIAWWIIESWLLK
jgi:hypothetical protein